MSDFEALSLMIMAALLLIAVIELVLKLIDRDSTKKPSRKA